MAEPEIPSEFPYLGRKRQAEEEEENMNKEDDSDDSDYSIGYDSDDPVFEILEGKADRKITYSLFGTRDEIISISISLHSLLDRIVIEGCSSMAGIEQLHDYLTDPKIKQEYTELSITEVEQDKPSLVKSFVSGFLSKGKPGGRKAFTGFKVGIRYTGKLKENDKIFGTIIGEGEPLEFRIASGQLVQGWEIGVNGMRVGDKRRITIPPDLWYAHLSYYFVWDNGDGGVVPPDSWLVIEVELVYVDSPTST
ncbi:hypothetical protein R3W88_028042 [Solanum pinnatisectum]|uniref:peptidylprolyl isomerase n=1 Tax=Solanum pinnatisectum TaxID=50273 RepID=A0AAV9LIZ8_9SOLN|nr:hypothetical protein R3W88_028042 [Solanum pinnatisectum]